MQGRDGREEERVSRKQPGISIVTVRSALLHMETNEDHGDKYMETNEPRKFLRHTGCPKLSMKTAPRQIVALATEAVPGAHPHA